jgi:hypothetical protein
MTDEIALVPTTAEPPKEEAPKVSPKEDPPEAPKKAEPKRRGRPPGKKAAPKEEPKKEPERVELPEPPPAPPRRLTPLELARAVREHSSIARETRTQHWVNVLSERLL